MDWNAFSTHLRHLSASAKRRVKQGFELAHELHKDQKRKSGEPYITHSVAVALRLIEVGADEDSIIAALLHDTVEDTPITLEEIHEQFGGDVAQLINGVTKLSYVDVAKKPNLNEQTETLRKIFRLMQQDLRIMVIKLYDRLHNMETIEFLSDQKQKTLAEETRDVFVKIADRLSMQELRTKMEAMCLATLEPELFSALTSLLQQNKSKSEKIQGLMEKTLEDEHADVLSDVKVHFEPKSWQRLKSQLIRGGSVKTGESDVTMVFVCADRDTCYRMLGILHDLWKQETLSFQDFINSPTINGYQGLHTTVILEDGTRVRCKIRTADMQEYAWKGITMCCFTKEGRDELAKLLPWTTQIPTLAEDTQYRSEDFWQSLQSDILGESITVHGPDDRTVQLPKGSSVLDGAFYLFQDKALQLATLRINGKEVPLYAALQHAATIDATFGKEPTVKREWLDWTKTRVAKARIRASLSGQSEEERALLGREILQEVLAERQQGFIEELGTEILKERIRPLGYSSMRELYLALADGRADPLATYSAIFHPLHVTNKKEAAACTVWYSANLNDLELAHRLNNVHRLYASEIRESVTKNEHPDRSRVRLRAHLTSEQQRSIKRDLAAAGATDISVEKKISKSFWSIFATILLAILWGLDPVFARFLIQSENVTSIDFTILRFWSLALIFTAITAFRGRSHFTQPLDLRHPLLWISAILLFFIALTTYASLHVGLASHYEILMASSGLIIATRFRTIGVGKAILLWGIFALIIALLRTSSAWNLESIAFTLISLCCFAAFLVTSNRYMQQTFVARRTLEYYTAMLLIGSLFAIPLVMFTSPSILEPLTIVKVAIFSFIFIGVPYYLYYEAPPKRQIDNIIPFAIIMLGATLLGEFLLTQTIDRLTLSAGFMMMLLSILLNQKLAKNSHA